MRSGLSCTPSPGAILTDWTNMGNSEISKIAFVGDYLPRKCGIATFTHDMYASVAGRFPDAECFVVVGRPDATGANVGVPGANRSRYEPPGKRGRWLVAAGRPVPKLGPRAG